MRRFQSNHPEKLEDRKRALLTLAKTAPRKIRNGLLPEQGSNALIGPEYNDLLADYIRSRWDLKAASARAPSLSRALSVVASLAAKFE